jgi:hypothetical protein
MWSVFRKRRRYSPVNTAVWYCLNFKARLAELQGRSVSSRKATNQNIQTCCLCVQKQHGSVLGTGYFAAGFAEIGLQLAHFVFRNRWRLVCHYLRHVPDWAR